MTQLLDHNGHPLLGLAPDAPTKGQDDVMRPPDPLTMIAHAVQAGIDPDQLGKLMDLYERVENRRAEERFSDALAAVQKDCGPIFKHRTAKVKGQSGTEWSYQFESYDDVMLPLQPILSEHGMSVSIEEQVDKQNDKGFLNLVVYLRVGSCEKKRYYRCPVPAQMSVNDTQKYGAAMSFAKRYALKAALNIVSTDQADNDAAALDDTLIAEEQDEIEAALRETGRDRAKFLKWLNYPSVPQILRKDFSKAMYELNRARQKMGGNGA